MLVIGVSIDDFDNDYKIILLTPCNLENIVLINYFK